MSPEQRLNRLTERHEALAQFVEESTRIHDREMAEFRAGMADLRDNITALSQATERLLAIAQNHQNRLDGQDRKISDLEHR